MYFSLKSSTSTYNLIFLIAAVKKEDIAYVGHKILTHVLYCSFIISLCSIKNSTGLFKGVFFIGFIAASLKLFVKFKAKNLCSISSIYLYDK